MGQKGKNIKQIRTKLKEDWAVGKERGPGGNCTGGLIISENS